MNKRKRKKKKKRKKYFRGVSEYFEIDSFQYITKHTLY